MTLASLDCALLAMLASPFDPSTDLIHSAGISMLTLSARYGESRPGILITLTSLPLLSEMFR